MQYCAMDVEATHQVFTEQLPLFIERSELLTHTRFPWTSSGNYLFICTLCKVTPLVRLKVPSSSDVGWHAGDGRELPSCQSELGAVP